MTEAEFPLWRNPFGVPPEIIIDGRRRWNDFHLPTCGLSSASSAQSSNNHCAIASNWVLAALLSTLQWKLIELQCLLACVKYPLDAATGRAPDERRRRCRGLLDTCRNVCGFWQKVTSCLDWYFLARYPCGALARVECVTLNQKQTFSCAPPSSLTPPSAVSSKGQPDI